MWIIEKGKRESKIEIKKRENEMKEKFTEKQFEKQRIRNDLRKIPGDPRCLQNTLQLRQSHTKNNK